MPSLAEASSRASFSRRSLAVPLLLSLLLNVAVLALLDHAAAPPPEEELAIPIELAPAPPPPAPPPPPKAEVKPQATPEVKPEAKPEPKPEAKPEPKPEPPKPAPPKVGPRKPPPLHLTPTPKVQHDSADGAPEAADLAKPEHPRLTAAQRDLRDLLMSQVVAIWSPPDAWRGRGAHFSLAVDLLPNGMLGPPYAGDRALDMRKAIIGWESLPPDQRELVGGLAQALYRAQPFHLSADAQAEAPVTVKLNFKVDDIP